MKLQIAGKVAGYPWRKFAEAAGWISPNPPEPPPPDVQIGGD